MKDYNRYMPKGSVIRKIVTNVINPDTHYYEDCLFIHYTDKSMPSDCSPHRIMKIVLDHGPEWDGIKVNSYKDYE